MNDYYTRMLCSRPSLTERHANAVKHGFTKHNLAEVSAAAVSLQDAHDAWVRVYADCSDALDAIVPIADRQYLGWEKYAPEAAQRLLGARREASDIAPSMGGDVLRAGHQNVEWFPISRWAWQEKRYVKAARILQKAIESVQQTA